VPFEETGGMLEQVRPEHVTEDEYRLPQEYSELIGGGVAPPGPVETLPEVPGAAERTAPERGDQVREPESYDWPFDDAPQAAGEGPAPKEPDEGWVRAVDYIDEGSKEGWYEPPPEQPPPTPPQPAAEPGPAEGGELNSFFFEDDSGKKDPGEEGSGHFWE
jgi:hypothetical protein